MESRRRSSSEPRWLDPPLQRMEDIEDAAMNANSHLYLKGEELQSKLVLGSFIHYRLKVHRGFDFLNIAQFLWAVIHICQQIAI